MGSPKGCEPYGDRVPVVVAGVTTCQGEREDRPQGEGAQVTGYYNREVCENCRAPKRYWVSSATRGIGHWRATCPETGPRGSEEGRAEKEFPRRKPPRRAAYPVHRDLGSGPIINPFPLDRARRGRRAHAHRNPMVRPAMSGPASTGPRCPAASRAARPGRRVQRDLRAVGLREPKRHLVGRLSPGEGTRSRLHLSLSATDVLCGIVKHRDNIFQSS